MVWYGHGLKGDFLGIFEVGVRSPDLVQPFDREKLVLSCHVLWQAKAVVIPLLPKKDVGSIGLKNEILTFNPSIEFED